MFLLDTGGGVLSSFSFSVILGLFGVVSIASFESSRAGSGEGRAKPGGTWW
jgi:hypothetical protein